MVRLKNDPVYNLMIQAASSISIASRLPAFVALLSSLDHWRKTELHDRHPYCFVFIQMFFNKDNYGKGFTALQQIHLSQFANDPQILGYFQTKLFRRIRLLPFSSAATTHLAFHSVSIQ